MTKGMLSETFIAMCRDPRTRFEEYGVGMAGPEHKNRRAIIRTENGDECAVVLMNYPGGYALNEHKLTQEEYETLIRAYDFGFGRRPKARLEEVRKMLGLQ